MRDVNRICAIYSLGPHYELALACLRQFYPAAQITALVPKGFPVSARLRDLANRVEETELERYSLRDLGAGFRLLRALRTEHYDVVLVMFNSPRLQVLAALSGAPIRFWATRSGRLALMESTAAGAVRRHLARRVRGRLNYAWIWLVVHLARVER